MNALLFLIVYEVQIYTLGSSVWVSKFGLSQSIFQTRKIKTLNKKGETKFCFLVFDIIIILLSSKMVKIYTIVYIFSSHHITMR